MQNPCDEKYRQTKKEPEEIGSFLRGLRVAILIARVIAKLDKSVIVPFLYLSKYIIQYSFVQINTVLEKL